MCTPCLHSSWRFGGALIRHSRPPIFFTNFIPFGPRLFAVSYHVKFTYPNLELVCHEEKLQTAQVR